jgi:hypothetical protein
MLGVDCRVGSRVLSLQVSHAWMGCTFCVWCGGGGAPCFVGNAKGRSLFCCVVMMAMGLCVWCVSQAVSFPIVSYSLAYGDVSGALVSAPGVWTVRVDDTRVPMMVV